MKLLISLLIIIFIGLPGQSYAQKLLRLEAGIIDLLEENANEANPYERPLSAFKLANSRADKRSSNLELMSLANFGALQQIPHTQTTDYEHALKYIEDKEWEKAMDKINNGLAIYPNHKELLRLAAIVSTMTKDFYMSNYYYGRYIELDPDNVQYIVGWAGVLMRTFRFTETERLLDRAENIAPGYLPTKFYRLILMVMESNDRPDNHFFLSLFLSDKQGVVEWICADRDVYEGFLGSRGFARLCDMAIGVGAINKLDEISKAIAEYQTAKNQEDNDLLKMLERLSEFSIDGLAIPMEKAIVMSNLGKEEEALEIMDNLISQYPSEPFLHFNYGYMLLRAKMYSKAETILRKSLALSDQGKTKLAIAITLILQNENKEAWTILEELAKANPQELASLLDGNTSHIDIIKADTPRYRALCDMVGIPPESQ